MPQLNWDDLAPEIQHRLEQDNPDLMAMRRAEELAKRKAKQAERDAMRVQWLKDKELITYSKRLRTTKFKIEPKPFNATRFLFNYIGVAIVFSYLVLRLA